jgi:epoxyqueuosine reductase
VNELLPTAAALTAFIRSEALRLGFHKVGIARAESSPEQAELLRTWIARGYHGSMRWMERTQEKRSDPELVLPGVRSIVSVAMNYYTPDAYPDDPAVGKVSRYAWGDDYHDLLGERLEQLLDAVKRRSPGTEGKVYVDTGPVAEKYWAERAGIGWRGKHTNVITREFGSWVFLGEVLLTAALAYDEPAYDLCGTCTRCLEACPTQAFPEPYVLDANRCISYLTIEHRGEIARELGERLDRWIYGCDTCQDVCPWNERFAAPTDQATFRRRDINHRPTAEEIAGMTDESFRAAYRHSPITRAKREGLQRNARLALPGHESSTSS